MCVCFNPFRDLRSYLRYQKCFEPLFQQSVERYSFASLSQLILDKCRYGDLYFNVAKAYMTIGEADQALAIFPMLLQNAEYNTPLVWLLMVFSLFLLPTLSSCLLSLSRNAHCRRRNAIVR